MIDERKKLKVSDKRDILCLDNYKETGGNLEKESEILLLQPKKQISKDFCNICEDRKINIAFQLCKHRYCCDLCVNDKLQNCPICNIKIKSFVRLYNI